MRRPSLAASLWLACTGVGHAAGAATPAGLADLERAYADFNDAQGAISLIDSDPARFPEQSYGGRGRAQWREAYVSRRAQLLAGLPAVPKTRLTAQDARAISVMQAAVEDSAATPESPAPRGRCSDAQRLDLALPSLQEALYTCFAGLGNELKFEGATVTRVAALEMLTHMEEEPRRRALFQAFVPLWQALNADDGPSSPYRRMIHLEAQSRAKGSPVDDAARTLGISPAEAERWLVRILDTWRQVSGAADVEPWDYYFAGGAAERELAAAIPLASLVALNQRYYQDLGLDLAGAQVLYDLNPRAGKAPLAYTDYVRRGRMEEGRWQPTLVRVSASYQRGGLGALDELVHENGHAAHMLALRTRPAFMDLGDAIFYEAFADVPAWNVYEPAWQEKYLGRSAPVSDSRRALFSAVMLDVAWALFDLRMLHHPQADPNAVWTQITHHYLRVKPHPELGWWALRVQLVETPGYMVNYGLGAVITADIRARIAAQLGPFDAGDPRWYGWISQQLLSSGEDFTTDRLLRRFLGRQVSPEALLKVLSTVLARDAR